MIFFKRVLYQRIGLIQHSFWDKIIGLTIYFFFGSWYNGHTEHLSDASFEEMQPK